MGCFHTNHFVTRWNCSSVRQIYTALFFLQLKHKTFKHICSLYAFHLLSTITVWAQKSFVIILYYCFLFKNTTTVRQQRKSNNLNYFLLSWFKKRKTLKNYKPAFIERFVKEFLSMGQRGSNFHAYASLLLKLRVSTDISMKLNMVIRCVNWLDKDFWSFVLLFAMQ